MIIGTAGHIDHGKTALVRALTGVDTDRLPEEKRRGITIDLGFAPLALDGDLHAAVVDVPGHEAFVRTMLAGATGIDVALLVVAADEGVMPQTREHVDILSLLDVRHGVVALTKSDLVEPDWLELVADDVRALLADTPLSGAPVIATSVVRETGLADLRTALADVLRGLPERDARDVFRMPVDRAFTMRGAGTVVTGTVWSGAATTDASLTLLPLGTSVRVRGLQRHGASVSRVAAGDRAAIALAGVDLAQVHRGSVLVGDAQWPLSDRLRVDVALLDRLPRPLRPRERVRLHLGTSDVAARIVAPGGPVQAGELRAARAMLEEPIAARAGDRFVLRASSPPITIGGGIVRDPAPPHRRVRPWPPSLVDPLERLRAMLTEGGLSGVAARGLAMRVGVMPEALGGLLQRADALMIAGRAYPGAALEQSVERLVHLVRDYQAQHPLDPGTPQAWLRSRLGLDEPAFDEIVRRALSSGAVVLRDGLLLQPGWAPRLDERQQAARAALLRQLAESGREPPATQELVAAHGQHVISLLRILEREGLVVPVEPQGARYYDVQCLTGLVQELRNAMSSGGVFTPAELREVLHMSRKFLIPFLEYCDREGITERRDAGRVLGTRGVRHGV